MIGGSEAAGFALALGAASLYDTGYAFQALEARRSPDRHAMRLSLLAHLLARPRWLAATALSAAGFPLQRDASRAISSGVIASGGSSPVSANNVI